MTGSLQVAEWGELETPVYLTATMSVGRIYDGAVVSASAEFEQGAVGAGTGMTCLGYKGGIGSSSRVAGPGGAVVGVLVQANFGDWNELRVDACRSGGCSGIPTPARTGRRAAASRWWRPTPHCPPVS